MLDKCNEMPLSSLENTDHRLNCSMLFLDACHINCLVIFCYMSSNLEDRENATLWLATFFNKCERVKKVFFFLLCHMLRVVQIDLLLMSSLLLNWVQKCHIPLGDTLHCVKLVNWSFKNCPFFLKQYFTSFLFKKL